MECVFQGILVDEDMNVISAGEYDIAIITYNDVLVIAPPSEYLTGAILRRIQELIKHVRISIHSTILTDSMRVVSVRGHINDCQIRPDAIVLSR